MSMLNIVLENGRTQYLPGEEVVATVSWKLDQPSNVIEVNLLWHTQGKGTVNAKIVDTVRFERPRQIDRSQVRLKLPASPYSFSGKLVSLVWAVEATVDLSKESTQVEISVSPTGQEIDLCSEE